MNSYIMTPTGITIFMLDHGKQHIVQNSHPRFDEIKQLVAQGQYDEVIDIIDVKAVLTKFMYASDSGKFKISDGVLTYNDNPIHSTLSKRMIEMASEGLVITPLENFMENLFQNPSYRAVNELYGFLEVGGLPITDDGHFLAYKKISKDYKDVHSGTFDNSIGAVCEMPRHLVDEDKNRTCSDGLHFCSYDYLSKFGGERVVVIKINPRDVVAIPSDYNDTKGRTCRYEVLRELEDWFDEEQRIESNTATDDGFVIISVGSGDFDFDFDFEEEEEDPYDVPVNAVDLRSGVSYMFDSISEASNETGVPSEDILRAIEYHQDDVLGYTFTAG